TSGNSALPRTPRTDPKQRVNDGQAMSDGQANGVHVSKVDYCGAPAASKESKKNTKTSKWETISQVVKNIYHMSRLEPYLYGIGQAHCKYADRGFRPDHWDVFQDAMEHSLAEHASGLADLDAEERQEAVVVWRTLALFVIAHMKAGFFDGLKSINKHPPLT
ncbi:hypothetical protein TELCIR_12168, partial [Teladorsagia circumcincta]